MGLDPLFAALQHDDAIEIPAGWGQGRATYGGLVAALLFARISAQVGAGSVLRSATVSFVGPVAPGPATVQAQLLRQGKSVVQAEARLIQNGEVLAAMLASFGAPRESAIAVAAPSAPAFKSPEESLAPPLVPGVTPEFLQHAELRWAHGSLPFTGATLAEMGGWMRLRESRGALDYADLFLLVDLWPPAVLPLAKAPAPGSTLCWTLEPVHLPAQKSAQHWWQYLARTDFAADGYGHAEARVWDDEGRLVAISRQTVVVFA